VRVGVIAIGATLLLAGCGASDAPRVDHLLLQIAAGGRARVHAGDELERILNRSRDAGTSADTRLVIRAANAVFADVEPLVGTGRPTCGSWAENPRYEEPELDAELIIDLAGRTGARATIRDALRLHDPYLQAWAIRSAVAAGMHVDDAFVARVAGDDNARFVLYDGGDAVVAHLPRALRTELARARADMTQWLVFPTELGCEPQDLELMQRVDRHDGRYYVFRFRTGGGDVEDANEWEAGVSGPWGADNEGYATFSDFERADKASPEQHVRRIVALVNEAE
jgi:hypothetical protein